MNSTIARDSFALTDWNPLTTPTTTTGAVERRTCSRVPIRRHDLRYRGGAQQVSPGKEQYLQNITGLALHCQKRSHIKKPKVCVCFWVGSLFQNTPFKIRMLIC